MKFLIVGDAMIDRYWIGRVERLNPERHTAPLLRITRHEDCPGGALNVLMNVQNLGAKGSSHIDQLACGMPSMTLAIKHRLVDEQEGIVARWDEEYLPCCSDFKTIESIGQKYDAVIVADYGKGSVEDSVIKAVLSLNKPVFVDTKMDPSPWIHPNVVAFFPNVSEYSMFSYEYDHAPRVLVKQGEAGLGMLLEGEQQADFPSVARAVRNVTGAGDTVIAAWSVAYMALGNNPTTANLSLASEFSMRVAAAAVADPLTAAPTWKDIEEINGGLCSGDVLIREKMQYRQ